MSINRNNYETYLIDYLDGTLDPYEVTEVLLFLDQHADIKAEFFEMNNAFLPKTKAHFNSSILLKSVQDRNELLLVKEIESDLSNIENNELQAAIKQNPNLISEQKLFTLTIQQPDYSIIYPNKTELKKQILNIFWFTPLLRIASVIVFLSVIGVIYYKNTQQHQPIVHNNQYSNKKTNTLKAFEQTKLTSNQTKEIRTPKKNNNTKTYLGKNKKIIINTFIVNAEKIPIIKPHLINMNFSTNTNKPLNAPILTIIKQLKVVDQDQFEDIKSLLARKVRQNTNKLLGESDTNRQITIVGLINKTTGVDLKIDNDTTSGRINHFELAALDFFWSKK